ncbi:hypothetical protein [Maridesulfovibrio frigidus]|uniref:hypothetical protein n=1 Tax=Maridesulfovibrio frigidus TaxID=340956 RepID=UPI0004E23EB6|nr:hypothetical protein [Maridesulfovibrio frigidus]
MLTLTSREWAIVTWVFVCVASISYAPRMAEVREAFKNAIRALLQYKIVIAISSIAAYTCTIVYFLHKYGLWDFSQIKGTTIWFFSVALFSLFKLSGNNNTSINFRHLLMDNIKLVLFIEIITGTYTLPFLAEMLLIPVVTFLGMMAVVAERDEQYNLVRKFISFTISTIGWGLIIYSTGELVSSLNKEAVQGLVTDYSLPPLLTLLYIPFLYFMHLALTYENTYYDIYFKLPSTKIRLFAIFAALIAFNVRTKLLERWAGRIFYADRESYKGIVDSIFLMFKMLHTEKKPQVVPRSDGWSPSQAKDFLLTEGIKTGYYEPAIDNLWHADSVEPKQMDFKTGNSFRYRIEGHEKAAIHLKLTLDMNNDAVAEELWDKFYTCTQVLFEKSMERSFPFELKEALLCKTPKAVLIDQICVSFSVEDLFNSTGYFFALTSSAEHIYYLSCRQDEEQPH